MSCTFQLLQGDTVVAEFSGTDRKECFFEAMHHAYVYAEEGPVIVREAGRLFDGNADIKVLLRQVRDW